MKRFLIAIFMLSAFSSAGAVDFTLRLGRMDLLMNVHQIEN